MFKTLAKYTNHVYSTSYFELLDSFSCTLHFDLRKSELINLQEAILSLNKCRYHKRAEMHLFLRFRSGRTSKSRDYISLTNINLDDYYYDKDMVELFRTQKVKYDLFKYYCKLGISKSLKQKDNQ